MRIFALIFIITAFAGCATFKSFSGTGLVKVLPNYLDEMGQHTDGVTLLHRDVYQNRLRKNPELVHGVRYDVNWYGSGEEQYRMDAFEAGRKEGVETRRHRNGNKKEETHWRAGHRHGVQTSWYPDGSKHEERRYEAGKRQGTWTRWHPNGVKEAAGQYQDGRPAGQWQRWNENGDLEDVGAPANP